MWDRYGSGPRELPAVSPVRGSNLDTYRCIASQPQPDQLWGCSLVNRLWRRKGVVCALSKNNGTLQRLKWWEFSVTLPSPVYKDCRGPYRWKSSTEKLYQFYLSDCVEVTWATYVGRASFCEPLDKMTFRVHVKRCARFKPCPISHPQPASKPLAGLRLLCVVLNSSCHFCDFVFKMPRSLPRL